jgi:5-formyltetrahydrofolate cyclo-ligase
MKNNSLKQLRKDFIAKRQLILYDPAVRHKVLSALHDHILKILSDVEGILQKKVQTIGFYWPIHGEPSITESLIDWQNENQQRKLALPLCKINTPLSFHEWSLSTPMTNGYGNIPEPHHSNLILPDLIFVPCIGWQSDSNHIWRLGYGGGFYDRTLHLWNETNYHPITIGVSLSNLEISTEVWRPQAHDMPLKGLVTESSIFLPKPI